MHPADIPTSTWATGLYVRNPLALTIPADAEPMRYRLRAGLYDRKSGGLFVHRRRRRCGRGGPGLGVAVGARAGPGRSASTVRR